MQPRWGGNSCLSLIRHLSIAPEAQQVLHVLSPPYPGEWPAIGVGPILGMPQGLNLLAVQEQQVGYAGVAGGLGHSTLSATPGQKVCIQSMW